MPASDILVGAATIWKAPVGEPFPDETTVEYGDPWGGNWTNMGYTKDGIKVGYTQETFEIEVDQVTNALDEIITKEVVIFETVLAELTGSNLATAFNGELTTTPAGSGQRGFEQVEMGGKADMDKYTFGLEGFYKNAQNEIFPVRVFIYKGAPTVNGQLQFMKNNIAGIPLRIKAYGDESKPKGKQTMVIQRVTGEASTT